MGNPFRTKATGCVVQVIGIGMALTGGLTLWGHGRITFAGTFPLLVGLLLIFMGAKARRTKN